jgi:hypothetical protein
MKTISATRILSLLAFLLLIAPFYDHCNGKRLIDKTLEQVTSSTDTIQSKIVDSISEKAPLISNDSIKKEEVEATPFYERAYDFIDDAESENAFEIAGFTSVYYETPFKKFKTEVKIGFQNRDFKGLFFHIKIISFLGIVIATFLMLLFSFSNKKVTFYKLSKLNLILLGLTIICTFLDGMFENFSQIKWGYYVFTLVQIALFMTLYKNQKSLMK